MTNTLAGFVDHAVRFRASLDKDMANRLGEYLARTEEEKSSLDPSRKIRETQVGTFTAADDLRTDRHDLVAELDEQCDYNYHLLSAHFRENLDRVANYWKASFYLRAAPRAGGRTQSGHSGPPPPAGVRPGGVSAAHPGAADPARRRPRVGGPPRQNHGPLPAAMLPLALGTPLQVLLANVPGTGPHLLVYNETGRVMHLDGQLS